MKSFIGRSKELHRLQVVYDTPGFQMSVVYGRRRVGKTRLLREFVRDKRAVFFTATRGNLSQNIKRLSSCLFDVFFPKGAGSSFESLDDIFKLLGELGKSERLVVVLDEFPYLAEQDPSLLSVLQMWIDSDWEQGQMFLILCGSSISYMEDEVLREKSPLYGRRTSQLLLRPLSYKEAAKFTSSYTYEEKALVYGITNGIPQYLSLFDDSKPLDDNIINLFFNVSGFLFNETSFLISQELRNSSMYNSIINAIASGKTKLNEIADTCQIKQQTLVNALTDLSSIEIVKKEHPITNVTKKNGHYIISDTMFQFWYKFLYNASFSLIDEAGDIFYFNKVKPYLSEYMGNIFENICRQYTLVEGCKGKLACHVCDIGRWWGTAPSTRKEVEIDVVGIDTQNKTAVLGECKFRNEVLDKVVFDNLKEKNGLIDHRYRTVQYLLFSKTGFSSWLHEHAHREQVLLVDLPALYREA